ncbi:MAG: hypothetical protein QN193_03460 [Armatimonadota bacterium]|nr:hypothetical protein [Armatimonadota bacterium]MDR7569647.1 hypothetical protein [Armatimonadota bacterium]MDR7614849.1 hypothetical protein [Armatimonadota bacterium]
MKEDRREAASTRARRLLGVAVAGLDQLVQALGLGIKWKDLQTAVSGAFALLRLGPWGVGGFVLLVCGLAGFGTVVFAGEAQRAWMLRGAAAQALLGAIAAFVFALLNAEVRPAHPALRFGMALYTLWYLLLPPVLALPRVVALVPAFTLYLLEVLRLRADRASPLWLFPWVLLLGRLSPGVVKPLWASVALWTVVYAGAGLALSRRPPRFPLPERAVLFAGMAVAYGGGIARGPARFGEALQMGYSALFTFLGLFWMWLAADLVDDASELAGRLVGRVRKVLGRRQVPAVVALMLAGLGILALGLALAPAAVLDLLPLFLLRPVSGFLQDAWTGGLALCGFLFLLVGLLTGWRALRGYDPVDAASDGLASGLVLALVYWGGAQAWSALSEVEAPSGWWPLLLASAPVLLEEFKQAAKGVRGEKALLVAAVSLLGLATTGFRFAADPQAAVRTTTLYPFLGMVLWGVPHLLARLVAGWSVEVPSARLFFAGYFSALPAAALAPSLRTGSPALAVLLWPLALRVARWEDPASPGLRVATGLLLASGTLAFYYDPLFLPVPFVPWTETLLRRLGQVQATEMLSWAQFLAWLGAAGAGTTAVLARGRVRWLVAAAVWFGWCRLLLFI